MEILHQLGALIVGSIPTIILFVLLVMAYSLLVRRPLERTLEDRRTRTVGAVDQARRAIAAAEAETAVYEDKIRAARQELAAERDRHLKQRQAERDQMLSTAREQAGQRIQQARAEVEASAEAARRQIEATVGELGDRIAQVLVPQTAGAGEVRP